MADLKIAYLGYEKKYEKGKLLFSAGEAAHGFYYVLSGEVRIYKSDEEGREVEVTRLGPESFLAEVILFASERYPVSAETTKLSKLIYFPKERVLDEIGKNSSTALFFLKLLAGKCLILNERLETMSLRTIRERLIRYLLEISKKETEVLTLEITKTELAERLGTISATLSRNFAELEKKGLVKIKGKEITIKSRRKLSSFLRS